MGTAEHQRIVLSGISPLNRGVERVCYVHPLEPELVIKVPLQVDKKKCGANEEELKGYHLLVKDKVKLDFISHCHGYVDTDMGQGLLCDCIRDADGEVSRTIWDIVIHQDDCDVNYIVEIAEKLCHTLKSNKVWIFDLNLKNIALQRKANGSYKPYIIDLKGRAVRTEFIPITRYIPYLSMKKLERRCNQLIDRIAEFRRRRFELQHHFGNE